MVRLEVRPIRIVTLKTLKSFPGVLDRLHLNDETLNFLFGKRKLLLEVILEISSPKDFNTVVVLFCSEYV